MIVGEPLDLSLSLIEISGVTGLGHGNDRCTRDAGRAANFVIQRVEKDLILFASFKNERLLSVVFRCIDMA